MTVCVGGFGGRLVPVYFTVYLLFLTTSAQDISKALTPPYFNLAHNSRVEATATCGEGTPEPELFCRLTAGTYGGFYSVHDYNFEENLIDGQVCDHCDSSEPRKAHPARQVTDGTERWWQSPPLSRGTSMNRVNLTIHLGQEFHVAYVYIRMGNSPRPGVFALERSRDNGRTWQTWQYFADTPSDCQHFFGKKADEQITDDDTVICSTRFSKVVPLENGEIVVSLVNGRPNADNFTFATELQQWTLATDIRLRLIRTKTLLGHLMAVARQDPTVTRRYFYSIKDVSIGGRCVCNGHAATCDKVDEQDPHRLLCNCQHNTCGAQCQKCCLGYTAKKWRKATRDHINACEPCQCFGHSSECIYDEEIDRQKKSLDIHGRYSGGGVCQNCRHNTAGVNCHQCRQGFYRPTGVPANSPHACQPCHCDAMFSSGICEDGTGHCQCKARYTGPKCDRCAVGYHDYPACKPCDCFYNGTYGHVCTPSYGTKCPCLPGFAGNKCNRCAYGYYGFPNCKSCYCRGARSFGWGCNPISGQCKCRKNYIGRTCDSCADGFFNFPKCTKCHCKPLATESGVCDKRTGRCLCQDKYRGRHCHLCQPGFYKFPACHDCKCDNQGSSQNICDPRGQCYCHVGFDGRRCNHCVVGYYGFPACKRCTCSSAGAISGSTCDKKSGRCKCKKSFAGRSCHKCRKGFYNYPVCEECSCDPAGSLRVPGYPVGGCGSKKLLPGHLCLCKKWVKGHTCDQCKEGFWNLKQTNLHGCEDCSCHRAGTVAGSHSCSGKLGQCKCKSLVKGRRCDICADGAYNLQDSNPFGCQACGCNPGGSVDATCDKNTGQCSCRSHVTGRKCDRSSPSFYIPSLDQHRYEMEDGYTIGDRPARFGFNETLFPGFSWKGYTIFSHIQDQVHLDIDITKPSVYQVIFHYVNTIKDDINGKVTLTPGQASSDDIQQRGSVIFQPSIIPGYVRVTDGSKVGSFVMNPGKWRLTLYSPKQVFVDYVVILPQAYYEARKLQEKVEHPCKISATNNPCLHYVYLDLSSFSSTEAADGLTPDGTRTQTFSNSSVLKILDSSGMAIINNNQLSLEMMIRIRRPGQYVFVVNYHSINNKETTQHLDVRVSSQGSFHPGKLDLPYCDIRSLCRIAVMTSDGDLSVFDLKTGYASVTLQGKQNVNLAVDSITAVPYGDFSLDMLSPQFRCIMEKDRCIGSQFPMPPGSVRFDVEDGVSAPGSGTVTSPPNIGDVSVKTIRLDDKSPSVQIRGQTSQPGDYGFVVQYYQPNRPSFPVEVKVIVNEQQYTGHFDADYCPAVSGCRGLVLFEDDITETHSLVNLDNSHWYITFDNSEGHPLWMDYLLVVPADQLHSEILKVEPVDQSNSFTAQCVHNYSTPQSSSADDKICNEALTKLSLNYNNGALECNCDKEGSKSRLCDQLGGQCLCRQNVIGRTCSQCRVGYYGFPFCKACKCRSGLCDHDTGECVCPARVTGPDCDRCQEATFGYDPILGCADCKCQAEGVDGSNVNCHATTGQCRCRSNIEGRRCERCKSGYFSYPQCHPCECDVRGTRSDVCRQDTGECLCKENVRGSRCSLCKQNTFNLNQNNDKGCTPCFCFGQTNQCRSSALRTNQIMDMKGFGVMGMDESDHSRLTVNGDSIMLDSGSVQSEAPLYWTLPDDYLGNRITSYGGRLVFKVSFSIPNRYRNKAHVLIQPDIRIKGNNFTLVHILPKQPIADLPATITVNLVETTFVHESTRASVSREQFLTVLADVEAVHIKASYYNVIDQVSLSGVQMDMASPDGRGRIATSVEQCQCPANYKGSSCEQCADGYYRIKAGSMLGVCVKCRCHNRADLCDPETGECRNCRDNFDGPQCLTCKPGHFSNPRTGSCDICACPLAVASNNFASGCSALNGITSQCFCLKGYKGEKCERCDVGYYGNPSSIGGKCRRCECNGNVAVSQQDQCDVRTGVCHNCINHSAGRNCQRCQQWYYGDAVSRKNCRQCTCDRIGTSHCNHQSGLCVCKPNVEGARCDKCKAGYYGFSSGNGCSACGCSLASYGQDCRESSGQCFCKPGVTGRSCDTCLPGHWSYNGAGCRKCDCVSGGSSGCDAVSGQCVCLPGVTGVQCDQCLSRWIMIPKVGCQDCDKCVHLLLDDLDKYDDLLRVRSISGIREASLQAQLNQNLETMKQNRDKIQQRLSELRKPPPSDFHNSMKSEIKQIESQLSGVVNHFRLTEQIAKTTHLESSHTKVTANDLSQNANMAVDLAQAALKLSNDVMDEFLHKIRVKNFATLIATAEKQLASMKSKDMASQLTKAEIELFLSRKVLKEADKLKNKGDKDMNMAATYHGKIVTLVSKLNDLTNSSRHSVDNSRAALDTMERAHMPVLMDKLDTMTRIIRQLPAVITSASNLNKLAKDVLDQSRGGYKVEDTEREITKLDRAYEDLKKIVSERSIELQKLKSLVPSCEAHSQNLQSKALLLDSLIADSRSSSQGALSITQGYAAIIDSVSAADNSSKSAALAAKDAERLMTGLGNKAELSKEKSLDLLKESRITKDKRMNDLKDRKQKAKEGVVTTGDKVESVELGLSSAVSHLGSLPEGGYHEKAVEASTMAMAAQDKVNRAQQKIMAVVDKLPEYQRRLSQATEDFTLSSQDFSLTKNQVNKATEYITDSSQLLPGINRRMEKMNRLREDVTRTVSDLQKKIGLARGEANRIRVGLKFSANTTLRVRNPQKLVDSGSRNKLSMYFKTSANNGLLAYIGPNRINNNGPNDFLSLEILDGRLAMTYDLGSGAARIMSTRFVNDDQWHQVIAERTGKTGRLVIRTNGRPDAVYGAGVQSPGRATVLNLDQQLTQFLIGGSPSVIRLPSEVISRRFVGGIEDVKFDSLPIGLWNFAFGQNNNVGFTYRDVLRQATPNSLKFDGNSYLILDKKNFNPTTTKSDVRFSFKTYASNGLMFLMGTGYDYFSLEMNNGQVLFQYNLGNGPALIRSKKKYNDGKWHELTAKRVRNDGLLKMNRVSVASGRAPGRQGTLEITDEIFFGGYEGSLVFSGVTTKGFEGCIKDIALGGAYRNINDYKTVKNVEQGCVPYAAVITLSPWVGTSSVIGGGGSAVFGGGSSSSGAGLGVSGGGSLSGSGNSGTVGGGLSGSGVSGGGLSGSGVNRGGLSGSGVSGGGLSGSGVSGGGLSGSGVNRGGLSGSGVSGGGLSGSGVNRGGLSGSGVSGGGLSGSGVRGGGLSGSGVSGGGLSGSGVNRGGLSGSGVSGGGLSGSGVNRGGLSGSGVSGGGLSGSGVNRGGLSGSGVSGGGLSGSGVRGGGLSGSGVSGGGVYRPGVSGGGLSGSGVNRGGLSGSGVSGGGLSGSGVNRGGLSGSGVSGGGLSGSGVNRGGLSGSGVSGGGLSGSGVSGGGLSGSGVSRGGLSGSGVNRGGLSGSGVSGGGLSGSGVSRGGLSGSGVSRGGLSGSGVSGGGLSGSGVSGGGLSGSGVNRGGLSGSGVSRGGLSGSGVSRGGLSGSGVSRGGLSGSGVNRGGLSGSGVNRGGLSGSGVNRGGLSGSGVSGGGLSGSGVSRGGLSGSGVSRGGLSGSGVSRGGLSGSGVSRGGLSGSGVNRGGLSGSGVSRGGLSGSGVSRGGLSGSGVSRGGLSGSGVNRGGLSGSGVSGGGLSGSGVSRGGLSGSGVSRGGLSGSGVSRGGLSGSGVNRGGLSGSGVNRGGLSGSGVSGGGLSGSGVSRGGLSGSGVSRGGLSGSGVNRGGLSGSGVSGGGLSGSGVSRGGLSGSGVSRGGLSGSGVNRGGLSGSGVSGGGLSGSGVSGGGLSGSGVNRGGLSGSGVSRGGLSGSGVSRGGLSGSGVSRGGLSGSGVNRGGLSGSGVSGGGLSGSGVSGGGLSGSGVSGGGLSGSGVSRGGLSGSGVNRGGLSGSGVSRGGLSGSGVSGGGLSGSGISGGGLSGSGVSGGGLSGSGVNRGGLSGSGVSGGGLSGSGVNRGGLSGSGVNRGGLSGSGVSRGGLSGSGVNRGGLSGSGVSRGGLSGSGISGGGLSGSGVSGGGLSGSGVSGGNVYGSGVNRGHLPGSGVSGGNVYGSGVNRGLSGSGVSGGGLSGSGVNRGGLSGSGVSGGGLSGSGLSGSGVSGGGFSRSGVSGGNVYGSGVNRGLSGSGVSGGNVYGSGVNRGGFTGSGVSGGGSSGPGVSRGGRDVYGSGVSGGGLSGSGVSGGGLSGSGVSGGGLYGSGVSRGGLSGSGVPGGKSSFIGSGSDNARNAGRTRISSYIKMPSVNIDRKFQAILKIRTLAKDGLIFYTANQDQSNSFSLSIVGGKIVATSDAGGGAKIYVESENSSYNDGQWHYITVTKNGIHLMLDIDEVEMVTKSTSSRRKKVSTTMPLFIGGVPADFSIVEGTLGTVQSFDGCIGDITINGQFMNFALSDPANRVGVFLGGCKIQVPDKLVPPPPPPPRPTSPCGLPLVPRPFGDSAVMFGSHPESRHQYSSAPDQFRLRSSFSLEFKTSAETGSIFYVADDKHIDHIALFIRKGLIVYSFNCGSGTSTITSKQAYNDEVWHRAEFLREEQNGRLIIDDQLVGTGKTSGSSKSVNILPPFYVGGLTSSAAVGADGNLAEAAKSFSGCIRKVQLNSLDFGTPEEFHTKTCPASEPGVFFSINGGHLILYDHFKVGLDLVIEVDIRPRTSSGVIVSIASQAGEYLILQLVNGHVIFSVDNGAGEVFARYEAGAGELCDGSWHHIKAQKAKNTVLLYVDQKFCKPGIGSSTTSIDSNDPLYIGGTPVSHMGIKTSINYVGCIRNLALKGTLQSISSAKKFGNVQQNSCPTT